MVSRNICANLTLSATEVGSLHSLCVMVNRSMDEKSVVAYGQCYRVSCSDHVITNNTGAMFVQVYARDETPSQEPSQSSLHDIRGKFQRLLKRLTCQKTLCNET